MIEEKEWSMSFTKLHKDIWNELQLTVVWDSVIAGSKGVVTTSSNSSQDNGDDCYRRPRSGIKWTIIAWGYG